MKSFLEAFVMTLRTILKDRSAVATLVVASVVYAFYYPVAYQHQIATRLPVVVVDLDKGAMSRELIRKLGAVRDVELTSVVDSQAQAQQRIRDRSAEGILLIDAQFERDILRGMPGQLTFLASGALLGRANTVSQGLALAVAGFSQEAALLQVRFEGGLAGSAIELVQRPLFNTREGYASAVVTGVAALIVHQTLLSGMVLLLATLREQRGGRIRAAAAPVLGAMAAFWLLGMLNMLFYSGFVFWFQDFPRGGDIQGLLLGAALYISALVAFGAFVGSFFRVREHAMQVILLTSMPLYFLAGLSWPRTSMPSLLAWLADLLPSTSGIIAMVKFNQMGASVAEAMPELVRLLLLTVIYGGLAMWRYRPLSARQPPARQIDDREHAAR